MAPTIRSRLPVRPAAGARMTGVPDSPPSGARPVPGLRQRALMLLPVVLPLMIYLLIRIGDSSRVALIVAAVALASVAVGSLVVARRRSGDRPD